MDKNIFRTGKVSSIDYKTGMIQVVYTDKDNAVTAKLPYANFNNEYSMPKIGEQVIVAHMSNGSSRGVVLGTMWNKKNIPEESGKGIYRKELSKTKGASYIRYDDESGEYLIRTPIMMLHGVDRTDVEGPEVNIAANLRTSFESPEHEAALQTVVVKGLEAADIDLEVKSNIKVMMNLVQLEALIRKVKLETAEDLELAAGKACRIKAAEDITIGAENCIRLEDEKFSTTLTAIMERLEALDNDTSARK